VRFNLLNWEFSGSATHFGLQVGAGAELALTDRITARAEYRYTALNKATYDVSAFTFTGDANVHSFRTSVLFQF
jgi:opacity protein-like surface antigen